MSLVTILAIYAVLWWIVLFAVLPLNVRTQAEAGEVEWGTDPGAPIRHGLGYKLLLTTLISAGFCAAFVLALETGLIDLRRI